MTTNRDITEATIVTFDELGPVGLISIDNPPVNAISHSVRLKLVDAITRAEKNPSIKALLMMASGELFSAGADISRLMGARGLGYDSVGHTCVGV